MFESIKLRKNVNTIQADSYTKKELLLVFFWTVSSMIALMTIILNSSWLIFISVPICIIYSIYLIRFLSGNLRLNVSLEQFDSNNQRNDSFFRTVSKLIGVLFFILILGLMIGLIFTIIMALIISGLIVIKKNRQELTSNVILVAIAISIYIGISYYFIEKQSAGFVILFVLGSLITFIAGLFLQKKSKISKVHFINGDYSQSLKAFLWGCLLSVPLALFNVLGNAYRFDTWVTVWWHPFHALTVGIAEEILFRLFLLPLVYLALKSTTEEKPRRALIAAVLVSALLHGMSHSGINPLGLVIGSLIYFVPIAYLYLSHDLESAIGFHAFIDFIRFYCAFFA